MIEKLEEQKISEFYQSLGLGNPTSISKFETISGNDKYLVTLGSRKTICSVYHNRSLDKVNRVYKFLEGLRQTNVKTAFPVAEPSELKGNPVLITEFLEGRPTIPQLDNYGRMAAILANIHEFSKQFLPNASVRHNPKVFLNSIPDTIDDSELISNSELSEVVDTLLRLSDLRSSIDDYMDKGLIHADPIIGNTITSFEGELFIIDFDNLRQDVLALDLGYLVEGLLSSQSGLGESEIDLLIQSYAEVYNLTIDQFNFLKIYIAFAIIDKVIYSLVLYFQNQSPENTQKLESRLQVFRKFKDYIFRIIKTNEES